ncbi:glycosyltransferase family 9 protein [bacterium]|nr:glycosyltransferase family 9 protein [candidate division CSSED10-310 bacterium]
MDRARECIGVPLLIRFGAMGDMILTTPLLRALAECHGTPCEVIGRGSFVSELLINLPFVGSIRTIQSNKTPYILNRPKQLLVDYLRNRPPGPVYLAQSDVISHRILEKAGVTATASDLTVERRVNEHVVDHMARLGGFADITGSVSPDYNRGTELQVTEKEKDHVRRILDRMDFSGRQYVVVQPGFRKCMNKRRRVSKGKFWPEERWVRLIQEILILSPDKRVLISGNAEEQPLTAGIADEVNDHRVSDLTLGLRPMLALLSMAHSMISLDTGPAHAAAALNCPLVVLFGKMDPRIIRPLSRTSPVLVQHGPPGAPLEDDLVGWQKHHSMDDISINTVVTAWASLLV